MKQRRKPGRTRDTVQGQCDACREGIGLKLKIEPRDPDYARLPLWLPRKRKEPNTKRRREYKRVIASSDFRKSRAKCLKDADYRCQIPGCEQVATDADHVTYERFGNEADEDLQALCMLHHRALTEQRRRKRIFG